MNEFADSRHFDDIAAQCLDDVLSGRRTVTECAAAHPEYAAELRPMLAAALLTAKLQAAPLAQAKADALETRLRAAMNASGARPSLPKSAPRRAHTAGLSFAFGRMAAMLALGLVLAFGSAGLVSASGSAAPGDPLYGLKRLWEAIVLALSPLSGPRDVLWMQIAHNRLYEIDILDDQGRLDEQTLTDLHRALYQLGQLRTPQNEAEVMALLREADELLARVRPQPEAVPVYDSLSAITRQSLQTGAPALPASEYPLLAESPLMQITPTPHQPTATYTPLPPTPTASLTPTVTASPSPTATITPSATSRIPATATRTPSPTVTPTPTVTATITPSATWTALPLPSGIQLTNAAPTLPPSVLPSATPPPQLPNDSDARVRETQQAVFLTQTAGAPPTSAP